MPKRRAPIIASTVMGIPMRANMVTNLQRLRGTGSIQVMVKYTAQSKIEHQHMTRLRPSCRMYIGCFPLTGKMYPTSTPELSAQLPRFLRRSIPPSHPPNRDNAGGTQPANFSPKRNLEGKSRNRLRCCFDPKVQFGP